MVISDFITRSNGCSTIEELVTAFEAAISQLGFDKFIYCLARGCLNAQTPVNHGIARSYPEDWMKHYMRKGYLDFDATYRYGLSHRGAFAWKQLQQEVPLTKKERLVLYEAEEAGLKNGITVSLHGPYGEVLGFGFASDHPDLTPTKDQLSTLYCLASQFHLVYSGFDKKPAASTIKLSDRQREILQWAAIGKSRAVIAEIMMISEHTVDEHFQCIFKKLDCRDRTVAVLKSIQLGLIRV